MKLKKLNSNDILACLAALAAVIVMALVFLAVHNFVSGIAYHLTMLFMKGFIK